MNCVLSLISNVEFSLIHSCLFEALSINVDLMFSFIFFYSIVHPTVRAEL